MKIENFDPSLRKSLLDDINDLENNEGIGNSNTLILPGVEETEEEEVDLEDFRQR